VHVVLCHPQDRDAIWLYLALKKTNPELVLVSPEELLLARSWTQRIESVHDDFDVTLSNGLRLASGQLGFLLNRMQAAEPVHWQKAGESDRQYVRSEVTAMLLAWLLQVEEHCLVMNPPVGFSLSGARWSTAEWTHAALDSGFGADPGARHGDAARTLVVGSECLIAGGGAALERRCLALSRRAGSPLLEIQHSLDGRTFHAATAHPELARYGAPLIALLGRKLEEANA
jgi:hypothetical protein